MNDPTRIPRVIDAVRMVWEGQPDLSFGAVVGMLENHGLSWGSTDEEVLHITQEIIAQHPPKLEESALKEAVFVIDVQLPSGNGDGRSLKTCRFTVSEDTVVVDRGEGENLGAWKHGGVAQSAVGGPLKIEDSNGNLQRLGIVTLISRLSDDHERQLVLCDDDMAVDINGDLATVTSRRRRDTETTRYRLTARPTVVCGELLSLPVASDRAHSEVECGSVLEVLQVG